MIIFNILSSGEPATTILVLLGAWLISITFAIVSHEFSHAFAASKMGDPTARLAGRMTMNPAKHLDPIGTLCLIVFGFGWAKGVPVNPTLFRNYRKGQIWVSLSGVTTNMILGIFFTFLSAISILFFNPDILILLFLQDLFIYSAIINYILAVFNILPIYPLDGFSLLQAFLPYDNKFMLFMRKYGILVLLLLLFTGLFSYLINAVLSLFYDRLIDLFYMIFI